MNEPPCLHEGERYGACGDARVERRGKSTPIAWRHVGAVNSIRSNTVEGLKAGPAVPWRWLERRGNAPTQIDGCLRQNPAYRPAHNDTWSSSGSTGRAPELILRKKNIRSVLRRSDAAYILFFILRFPSCATRSARRRCPRIFPAFFPCFLYRSRWRA